MNESRVTEEHWDGSGSCCPVPGYPCPRVKPWESRTMVVVAVQGALR